MGIRELRAKWEKPFEEFWAAYPRKVDRQRAQSLFVGLAEGGADLDLIIDKARSYSRNVDPRDLKYVPSPYTWLRDERWEDEDLFTDENVAKREWFADKWRRADAAAVAQRYGFIYNHPPIPDDVEDAEAWHADQRKLWVGQVARHILHGDPPPE